jgi:hypothetical protein
MGELLMGTRVVSRGTWVIVAVIVVFVVAAVVIPYLMVTGNGHRAPHPAVTRKQ